MPNFPMSTALGHRGRALTLPADYRLKYNINGELKVQRPEAVLSVRVIAGRGRRHCSHILRWVCSFIVSCTLYTFTLYRDRGQCSHILRWVCSFIVPCTLNHCTLFTFTLYVVQRQKPLQPYITLCPLFIVSCTLHCT